MYRSPAPVHVYTAVAGSYLRDFELRCPRGAASCRKARNTKQEIAIGVDTFGDTTLTGIMAQVRSDRTQVGQLRRKFE